MLAISTGMGLLRLRRWAWVTTVLIIGLNLATFPLFGVVEVLRFPSGTASVWQLLFEFSIILGANLSAISVLSKPEIKKAFNAPPHSLRLLVAVMILVAVGLVFFLFAALSALKGLR